ncbi:MAG: hypothetical protein R3E50_11310 [Halioglobus sp.]
MLYRLVVWLLAMACLLLVACDNFDVKVNDRVVYSPTPLFSDFSTPDPGLTSCLRQAINDGVVTQAGQLTTLDCSFAGIENLDGLATFTGLTGLRLSANRIRNLVELNKLVSLQELYLDDNQIIDPVPLYALPALRQVDLSGNPGLQCPRPDSFAGTTQVVLPKHCR